MTPAITAVVLEVPHRFGAPREQLAWIAEHLPAADLIVLPEAALTGYVSSGSDFDLSPQAETRGGETERALRGLARSRGCALLAPLIEREGNRCYNSALFIDATGEVLARYRKRHPWMPETWATPGREPPPVIHWRGLALTIAICFDVHFLLEESARELACADALLFPSAWTEEEDSRATLLPELARRAGCMVYNANWGTGVPRVPGQGGSMIVSNRGEIVARGGPSCSAVLTPRERGAPASSEL